MTRCGECGTSRGVVDESLLCDRCLAWQEAYAESPENMTVLTIEDYNDALGEEWRSHTFDDDSHDIPGVPEEDE